ncbi:hypothetical protein [Streptomyces sp. NBC_00304]|uniref:hypothetical protein n=1 Tax=Streptomyces sp. NBC_00304 TaxID=2975706 RepID=UPI002E2B4028|nr:hypothetical protein [Streptomyces sp. NBC_00304]
MIRIVTTARLRRQAAALAQARSRGVEIQEQADRQFAGHTRSALALSSRMQRSEHSRDVLRAALEDARNELEALKAAPRTVVVLLHYGELHSIHPSIQAAEDHAVAAGAHRAWWGPSTDLPAFKVTWRTLTFSVTPDAEVA